MRIVVAGGGWGGCAAAAPAAEREAVTPAMISGASISTEHPSGV